MAKECAKVLAELMDAGFEATSESGTIHSDYTTDFLFSAMLTYTDTNRSKLGYDVDIVVHTTKSASWINAMFSYLHHQGLKPALMT